MKIRSMILVAPSVGFVFMVVLGLASLLGIRTVQGSLNELVEKRMGRTVQAYESREALLNANQLAYKLIAWIGNYDEAKIATATKQIRARVGEAQKILQSISADEELSAEQKAMTARMLQGVAKYGKSVDQAIDLASADPATGAAMMQSADKAFVALSKDLDDMLEAQSQLVKQSHEQAKQKARTMLILSGILLAAALGTSLLLAGYFTRRIVSKLGGEPDDASSIMLRLAQGDTNITINAGAAHTQSVFAGMHALHVMLQRVVSAQQEMARQHLAGETDYRIPTTDLQGVYARMAEGTNALVDTHLNTTAQIVALVDQYAAGNFSHSMPALPGRQIAITKAMQAVRQVLGDSAVAAAENARVRQALDSSSTAVWIADAQARIVYVNEAMQRTLDGVAGELQRSDPSFSSRQVLGKPVAQIYGARLDVHAAKRRNGEVVPLVLGDKEFAVMTTTVSSASGEVLGSIDEWIDHTDETLAQAEIAALVQAASQGDFSRRIAVAGKRGFFLDLAHALNPLMASNERALADVGQLLRAMADGDLSRRITESYSGQLKAIADDANTTADILTRTVTQIQEVAAHVLSGAGEISSGNLELSKRTEAQATDIEETAEAMSQINATVQNNAASAQRATVLAREASDIASGGGVVMQDVERTMHAIQDSAKRIADITAIIDAIAFQTNILALNAAVEAARAGEQGRGFAVVAAEVRVLAQRSADAARQIRTLIEDSTTRIAGGARLANEAGSTMRRIVSAVSDVTERMNEISHASSEQAGGVEQISRAIGNIENATQQNSGLVEESAAAAAQLEEQARSLQDAVSFFRVEEIAPMRRGKSRLLVHRA